MAELSNDPTGALSPTITYDIHHKGSLRQAHDHLEQALKRYDPQFHRAGKPLVSNRLRKNPMH